SVRGPDDRRLRRVDAGPARAAPARRSRGGRPLLLHRGLLDRPHRRGFPLLQPRGLAEGPVLPHRPFHADLAVRRARGNELVGRGALLARRKPMTSPNLVLALRLAGIVQLVITAANFFIPGKLGYARELPKLSPIVRQVHIIHHLYIVLVVFGLAVLSLFYPKELLSGTPLSRFL